MSPCLGTSNEEEETFPGVGNAIVDHISFYLQYIHPNFTPGHSSLDRFCLLIEVFPLFP